VQARALGETLIQRMDFGKWAGACGIEARFDRHAPRKRGTQQYEAQMLNSKFAEYWVVRSSRTMTAHQKGGPRPAVFDHDIADTIGCPGGAEAPPGL